MTGDEIAHRLAGFFTRRAGPIIIGLGVTMLVAYVTTMSVFPRTGGRVVFGDATHHFVQLRSLVFDRDLHFQNDYIRIYGLKDGNARPDWVFTELTKTGYVRNYMPIGPAILWAPLYLVAVAFHWLFALAGAVPRPDGFEWTLQLTTGMTGIAAATAGAWVSWRMAARYTSAPAACFGTIGVWIGTHALYYSLASPTYSHAASMLTSAAFFSCWLATRDQPTIVRAAVWGGLVGAGALMRWQDALFLLVPLIDITRWNRPWSTRLVGASAACLAAAIVFLPQMVVWHALYGQALALPQGPSFMQWTSPHMLAVLFSDNHGLFPWAPLLVPAVIGLVAFLRSQRRMVLPLGAVVLGSWYVNAAVADWWAGEAFGARRFLSLFPLFVLGTSVWIDGRERVPPVGTRRVAVLSLLTAANLLLLLQYQLFMKGLVDVAPYPHGWFDMWVARFVVPVRLVEWWLR